MFRNFIFIFNFIFYISITSTYAESIRLITLEGKNIPVDVVVNKKQKVPTIIYVTGLGGKGNEVSKISELFMKNSLNLITFDRNEIKCNGFECFKTVGQRSSSGQLIYDENEKETAIENILKNEITTVFNFVRDSDWYDENEGIYVIGGSFGSWLSLGILANKNLSKDVKGIIFLSPSVAPHKSTGKYANEIIKYNKLTSYKYNSKCLGIGSPNDKLFPGATTEDAVEFLKKNLPCTSFKKLIINSNLHAKKLLINDKNIQKLIINWINN